MRLVVVRHAQPAVDPGTPQDTWPLTRAGRRAARRLALSLENAPDAVASSPERKAIETGEPIAARFELALAVDERLRETARPWIDGDYPTLVHRWLAGETLDGWEPRDNVTERWDEAIRQSTTSSQGNVIIVGHGLAMTAWAAHRFGIDPIEFWTGLDFPCVREFAI